MTTPTTSPTSARTLTGHEKRAISVEALVDPRTLARHLRGEPVRPMARTRIEAAMLKLNLAAPAPSAAPPSAGPDVPDLDLPPGL